MSRTNIPVFKSKTVALIDTLHLTDNEVIGLALTLAASYGKGLARTQLHDMLDASINHLDEAAAAAVEGHSGGGNAS